ncbi:MAG TPA: hypothetical protein DIT89_14375 [Planctomycetaceae bacterium]|nr:hypothetical protein [Planctomycetaceae bacterium]
MTSDISSSSSSSPSNPNSSSNSSRSSSSSKSSLFTTAFFIPQHHLPAENRNPRRPTTCRGSEKSTESHVTDSLSGCACIVNQAHFHARANITKIISNTRISTQTRTLTMIEVLYFMSGVAARIAAYCGVHTKAAFLFSR